MVFVMAVSVGTLIAAQARVHELKLLPQNVHWGYYDPSVKPVLPMASGDTVRVEPMIPRGLPQLRAAGVKGRDPESLKLVERTSPSAGRCAPDDGPIFVDGAAPGGVLEVS
jgi:acetamidase/formamidase